MRGITLHCGGRETGSPNISWAWYWFSCLNSETDQSIQSFCLWRITCVRRGLMCPLFIAANIIASLTGRVLCGSYHAGVLSLVAVCWCAITFNWSKCIWGTFISGRILIGSLSTNVIVVCFVEDRRDAAIYISIAAMVSTGEWSIATMIVWRKVYLHVGIRAAGWDISQNNRFIKLSCKTYITKILEGHNW